MTVTANTGHPTEANTIKYAMYAQVGGVWRFEGWLEYDNTNPDEASAKISKAKAECESDNGDNSFRVFAFLDEPWKANQAEFVPVGVTPAPVAPIPSTGETDNDGGV